MTLAICYKCGTKKTYAISACPACKIMPSDDDSLSISWLLTDTMHTVDQLVKFSDDLKAQHKLSFDPVLEQKAKTIVNNMRSRTKPTSGSISKSSASSSSAGPYSEPEKSAPSEGSRGKTSIHFSAFNLLGASTRDDRRRIVELAEEKVFCWILKVAPRHELT